MYNCSDDFTSPSLLCCCLVQQQKLTNPLNTSCSQALSGEGSEADTCLHLAGKQLASFKYIVYLSSQCPVSQILLCSSQDHGPLFLESYIPKVLYSQVLIPNASAVIFC